MTQVPILDKVVCVLLGANAQKKSMHPSLPLPLPAIGKRLRFLTLVRRRSRRKKTLNANQFYSTWELTRCHMLSVAERLDKYILRSNVLEKGMNPLQAMDE